MIVITSVFVAGMSVASGETFPAFFGMRKASSWNSSWRTEFTCSRSKFTENHGLDVGWNFRLLAAKTF